MFFFARKNLRVWISCYKIALIYNIKSGLGDFLSGEKIFFDFEKNMFFRKIFIFHRAHAFRIPNPKDGRLTPKTQKVTTETSKRCFLSQSWDLATRVREY